jgi:hypothetical protein
VLSIISLEKRTPAAIWPVSANRSWQRRPSWLSGHAGNDHSLTKSADRIHHDGPAVYQDDEEQEEIAELSAQADHADNGYELQQLTQKISQIGAEVGHQKPGCEICLGLDPESRYEYGG